MKHKQLHLILLALGTILGALVRFWNLSAAVDELGLFISDHPATLVLVGLGILFVLVFGLLSLRSPGRGVDHGVMTFTTGQANLSLAAAWFLLLGTLLEVLSASFGLEFILLFLLGLAAAFSMILLSRMRRRGNQSAPPELIPIFFLLLKLIFSFKSWSTDPIILDYCDKLFALIFTLLAFYGIAGFCFDRGQPRRTLFCASCGIFFSAMAAVECFMEGAWAAALSYLGLILWLWPSVSCLLVPHEAPQKQELKEADQEKDQKKTK